jgi:hypothetical protein
MNQQSSNIIISDKLNTFKHKLHLDPIKYKDKPSTEAGTITKRIIHHVMEITIMDLAVSITRGQTWIPAHLEGGKNNSSWSSQSLFALDFDCGIPFDVLLTVLNDKGLDCTFAYTTFSNTTDHPKYRIVWQLNKVVTDIAEQKQVMDALKKILPEHDKQATAPSQMFYGGKELIYTNYDYYLDLSRLLVEVASVMTANSKPKNISRDLSRLNKKTDVKKWMKSGVAYNNNYRQFQKSSKSTTQSPLLKVDWNYLTAEIKVLGDMVSGKWLNYTEYFGLVSNLIYLSGGVALYKKSLDMMVALHKNETEFQKSIREKPNFLNKLYNLPSVIKAYDYQPEQLSKFSSYADDHIYSNLIHAAKKYEVIRVKPYKTIPLSDAEQRFSALFKYAIESDDTNVHIFKVATSLGKTKQLEVIPNALIALPNHDLKNQVADRMKIPVIVTPSLPENLPFKVKEQINYYFSIGAIEEANRFIAKEAETNKDLGDYRRKLKAAYTSDKTVLTTHSKAVLIDFDNLNTVIYDEDPIFSLLSIGSISVNDLVRLRGRIADTADQEALIAYINSIVDGLKSCPLPTGKIGFRNFRAIEDEILSNNYRYQGNVLAFFNSDWYVADAHDTSTIYFIKNNSLPANKKVIIMSATADKEMYARLVGDRLRFYDISNVQMMGIIEQDNTYSFSRSSLTSEKCQKYAQRVAGDDPVLTYMGYKHLFDNPVDLMHFGKLSGFDDLTGQNITVVGTPHQNPIVYLLFATALGIDFKPKDFRMAVQLVERHGIRYPLNTYDHEGLRNLQLFFIESEIIQAVGRARPLRNPVLIKLLSQCIPPMACINAEEKVLGRKRLEANKKDRALTVLSYA